MRVALLLGVGLLLPACGGGGGGGGGGPVGPPEVAAFAAAQGNAQLTLSWTLPVFAGLAAVEVRRSTTGPPATRADGTQAYSGTGTGFVDPGLSNGTRYHYSAFVVDAAGSSSTGVSTRGVPNPAGSVGLSFAGVGGGGGSHGIFDPSLAADPTNGRLWMSYSEVLDSVMWPGQNAWIQTRLSYSDNAGATWMESGLVLNAAQDVVLPLAPPNNAGTWVHEVSSLVRDAYAPAAERWKLMWHRYLTVNGVRVFEHGWIALKTAPDPTGPWSAERKLFVGSLYNTVNDVVIGPPEVQLNLLHPDLNSTIVFSEPGMLVTSSGLYVALLAADGTVAAGRVILLRLPTGSAIWDYRGTLLLNAVDGPALGYDGLSAPALYEQDGEVHLIATPQTNSFYEGTLVFRFTNLDAALIERTGGVPQAHFSHFGSPGSFNGAATYVPEATASGLIYSEALPVAPILFTIYRSRRNP